MQRTTGNRRITRHLLIAATAVAALTAGMPAAHAEDPDSDQAVISAVEKVIDGTAGQADCSLAATSSIAGGLTCPGTPDEYHEETIDYTVLAGGEKVSEDYTAAELDEVLAVPANADVTTSDEVVIPGLDAPTDGTDPDAADATGRWKQVRYSVTRHSLLGSVIYDYHTVVNFKYNGSKVVAWGSRYDYFTRESSVVDTIGREYNSKSALPTSTAYSTMKYKVKLCTLGSWGCYATTYPYIQTRVTGGGSYSRYKAAS
ncbi:hypothetical protein [Streptomyces sp. CO7]